MRKKFPHKLHLSSIRRSFIGEALVRLKTHSRLEAKLRAGEFVITAETTPPDAASAAAVLDKASCLKNNVDALNVTDGAGARAHMSAFAAATILAQDGFEPVLQFTVRDRNRLAIQGEMIGAAALGISNILCLHGDSVTKGDQPNAKSVEDLDSIGLIATAHRLREEGSLPSGRVIDPTPALYIGAADMPHDPGPDFSPAKLEAKIDAGADFFQTQFAYDLEVLERYMSRLRGYGITDRAHFIIGVGPLTSAKSARWMNEKLFGVYVPEHVIERLENASNAADEGKRICLELIDGFRQVTGVAGAHVMTPRGEQVIANTLAELRAPAPVL